MDLGGLHDAARRQLVPSRFVDEACKGDGVKHIIHGMGRFRPDVPGGTVAGTGANGRVVYTIGNAGRPFDRLDNLADLNL